MDNTYFRDQILSRGFKGIRYVRERQRIEPLLSLTASEMAAMTRDALNNYGFSDYTDVANYINRVTRDFKSAPGTSMPKATLNAIGNGDLVIVRDAEEAELRMIKLGLNRFLVTSDTASVLLPADELYLLQHAIEVGKPLYAQAYRNAQLLPGQGYVFYIEEVAELEVAHGNYFQYHNFFNANPAGNVAETTSPTIVYANEYDTAFNGFTDAALTTANEGQLIEINLTTMTYRLNPQFDRDKHYADTAIFASIETAFEVVAPGSNIYRLQPVAEGTIALSSQSGVHYLSVIRKAQCTLQ